MSFVATAIVGSAVVGYVAADNAVDAAANAATSGATTAAQAEILSAQMQTEEIARQFDYQQQILLPQIQQQYNAQGAFSDLLGISGLQVGQNPDTGYIPTARTRDEQQAERDRQISGYQQSIAQAQAQLSALPAPLSGFFGQNLDPYKDERAELQAQVTGYQNEIDRINASPWDQEIIDSDNLARGPQFPASGSTTFRRGSRGEFLDPNLDPTRLADVNTYGNAVRRNLLAGTGPESDPYRRYIDRNRIAAPTAEEDARFARARDVTMTDLRGGDTLEARRGDVSLADERGNALLAPGTLEEDVVRSDIAGRALAEGAAGTGVYGETFEASPGYDFAVEQMQRETDRLRSRGGNYGGRAMIEAQRRAQGLANQEYYNWAAGRTQDLQRLASAEAADASRLDAAARGYQDRVTQDVLRGDQFAATDISRGDEFARTDLARADEFMASDIARGDRALEQYEAQRVADIGRQDQGYQDYLRRREGDVARLDAAAQQEDRLMAADQERRDQAYYNYLSNVARAAGFGGGPAATAVSASQEAGAQTANAYAQQGAGLSSIYQNYGSDMANIRGNQVANQANAITSGIGNWLTYQAIR